MADQTTTIPKGWKMTTLGQQIKVGRGSSPRPIQDFLSDHGIPWVKIADASASETRYITKTKEFIKEEGRSTSVKTGDLIVSNSATPGIPKFMGIDACVHDGWLVFSEYKDLDKLFLYYFFLDYRRTLEHSASGTVFVNLQTEIVRNIELNLPSLPEQRAIAAVLSSLDDKIELLREQNKTLEATAQAVFKEWFVNFNFPGATGKMIDSELGKIPEGWRVGKIKDLVDILSGFAFSSSNFSQDGKYKLVTIKNVQDRHFDPETKDRLSALPARIPDYCKLDTGDILLSLTGNVGRICLVNGDNFLLNQRVAKLKEKNPSDYAFTYLLFLQDSIFSLLQSTASGTAQQNLSPIQTKEIEIIIADRKTLDQFGMVANKLIQKISDNNSQIQTLSRLRDTLLPKLMKGEVRVAGFNE